MTINISTVCTELKDKVVVQLKIAVNLKIIGTNKSCCTLSLIHASEVY